jgi:hypothetical protein
MVHPSPTVLPSSVGTTAPESLLVRYIKAHVRKGDQAKNKSDQHYIAAGRYLITLKVSYAPSWADWEDLLRIKVGLSTGRASELMQIADGRKSVQEIRDGKAQSVARLRASKSLHYSSEEESDLGGPSSSLATALYGARWLALGPSGSKSDPNQLIDVLARSDAATRVSAADALISGARHSQFEAVTNAVIDLYQRLSRAGR